MKSLDYCHVEKTPNRNLVEIRLDGVVIKGVFEASVTGGWVKVWRNHGESETLTGRVEIFEREAFGEPLPPVSFHLNPVVIIVSGGGVSFQAVYQAWTEEMAARMVNEFVDEERFPQNFNNLAALQQITYGTELSAQEQLHAAVARLVREGCDLADVIRGITKIYNHTAVGNDGHSTNP